MKTATTKSTKTNKTQKTSTQETKLFLGNVQATKVFSRKMAEFKNCKATCWLLFNEKAGTVTFANSYNSETPKSSYDASHYTYTYNPKVHDKKMDEMTELDVTDWPAWITNAAGRKTRKTK